MKRMALGRTGQIFCILFTLIGLSESGASHRPERQTGSGRVGDACAFNTDCLTGMFCNAGLCSCLTTYIAAESYCYQKIDPGQPGCVYNEQCSAVWPGAVCDTSAGVGTCRCAENKVERATRDGHVCLDLLDANENTLAITCPLPEGAGYTSALSDPTHPKQNEGPGPVLCNTESTQTHQPGDDLGDGSAACLFPSDGSYIADIYDCVEFVSTLDLTSSGYSEKANGICCPNRAFTCVQPASTGPNPTEPRWWYNAVTGVCQQFLWDPSATGPGEHSPNNFRTVEHCESFCRDSCTRGAPEYETRSSFLEETPLTGCSQTTSCSNNFECKTVGSTQWCCPTVASICGMIGGRPLDPLAQSRESVYHPGVIKQGTAPSTRFYYEPSNGKCAPFTYLGAGGNYNNFMSRIDCELYCARLQCERGNPLRIGDMTQSCQSNNDCPSSHECKMDQNVCCPKMQTICTQPLRIGNCDRAVRRFWYSASTRECQSFEYTGCQGNDNNFETLVDCQTFCRNAAPEPRCLQGQAYKDNSAKFLTCSTNKQAQSCPANYECHFDGTMYGCCPTKAYTCSLTSNAGKTCGPGISYKYYYNAQSQCCASSWPDIASQIQNVDKFCELQPDLQLRECESFEYLGCDGNSNNFASRSECENYCGVGGCSNGGIPLRDSSGALQTCSEKNGGCPSTHECQSVSLGSDVTSHRCCPSKTYICSLPPQQGSSLCSGGLTVVSRYYFNIVTKKCSSFVYNGCDGNPNNFASMNQCNSFCMASACPAGDVVYLNPNNQLPISCNDEIQNNCPKNFECVYDSLTDQSVCCGATDMGVCPDGEKAYINSMDMTVRECLINEPNSCPPEYLCRFNPIKNRYFCCGNVNKKKGYCPAGRAPFKHQTSFQPIRCTMNIHSAGCPDGFECLSDVKDALQGYCCSLSDICPHKEDYYVDDSSGMPRSCTVGHFVTCPQGYSCMAPFDGVVGYCCKGQPQQTATDGCPPGEIVYMERNEVVACDPFNPANQGCPGSFTCQFSIRTQRYQCCGTDPLPVPVENDGCPSRQIAYNDPDTGKPKVCTSATHSCPNGYFCQFSNQNKQFQCCGIPSDCPAPMVAFIGISGEPQDCALQGGQPCPQDFTCIKGRSGQELCCAGGPDCSSSQVNIDGQCFSRQPIGGECVDDRQCVGGASCTQMECKCPERTKEEAQQCVPEKPACSDRQVLVINECLPRVSLGRSCVHTAQCPTRAECMEGVCDCPSYLIRKGDVCERRQPTATIMPKSVDPVTNIPRTAAPETRTIVTSTRQTTLAPIDGLCGLNRLPYLSNGIARRCSLGQTCPAGYQCTFSKAVQVYFCCSTNRANVKTSVLKDACINGEPLVFPKTGQPVVCNRHNRCPNGFYCRRNALNRQFHCCSVPKASLDMQAYLQQVNRRKVQTAQQQISFFHAPPKKVKKINKSTQCAGHLVLLEIEINKKIVRRCQSSCPQTMRPINGICKKIKS